MQSGKNYRQCPLETPVIIGDSQQCTTCPSNAPIYNIETKACVSCPTGLEYSVDERKCVETCCELGHYYNWQNKRC